MVSHITLAELKDNYDLRSLLESYALEKNFPNLDPQLANDYGIKFQEILAKHDWQAYLKLDELFHVFLTENTGNPTLQRTIDLLRTQTNRMRYAIVDNDRCMKSSVQEIMDIISAVEKKDILLASNALKKHIKNVYDWEQQFLQK
ncbi:GntR family transcriptional regulator [Lactobacillus crispatus]|uniref:GntR family transcriptional regulator n=1 Tax=Lactobacillus crispatus TaxID=47770 RepID=UPI002E33BC92|nr:FCD domain-containing protein [Lactobacillus crispatus]